MKASIRLPYSQDHMVVETQHVRRLMNLQIVQLTVPGQVINLTQDIARTLGLALLSASGDQPVVASSSQSLTPQSMGAR